MPNFQSVKQSAIRQSRVLDETWDNPPKKRSKPKKREYSLEGWHLVIIIAIFVLGAIAFAGLWLNRSFEVDFEKTQDRTKFHLGTKESRAVQTAIQPTTKP